MNGGSKQATKRSDLHVLTRMVTTALPLHIAAIDNITLTLPSEGGRPMSAGFWFSLGHSTVGLIDGLDLELVDQAPVNEGVS